MTLAASADGAPDLAPIIAAIRDDGVYVDPTMATLVPTGTEQTLVGDVAKADPAVYVVVYPLDSDDFFGGDGEALARTLVDDGAPAGTYVVGFINYDELPTTDVVSLGVDRDVLYAGLLGTEAGAKGLDRGLEVAVPAVVDGTSETQYRKLSGEERSSTSSSSTGQEVTGEQGDGGLVGPVVGIGAVLALVVGAVLLLRRRSRGRRRDRSLPAAVLRRVRDASDAQLARRAETEVLALGEALDEHEIDPGDDADAWQAALDHYEAARRTLEDPDTSADVIGAVVLAERGRAALAAADAGEEWTPTAPCYLNPLHGAATTEATWHGARFPACRACARAVAKDQEPDALTVTVDGESVHYAEADVEPWASTGYGALQEDLLAALRRRR